MKNSFFDPRRTRRDTENTFLIRGVTRRGAENSEGVSGFLCAAGRLFAYLLHFAREKQCSDRRQRVLVYQQAQAAANCAYHYSFNRTQPQACHRGRRLVRARAIDLGCQRVLAGAGRQKLLAPDRSPAPVPSDTLNPTLSATTVGRQRCNRTAAIRREARRTAISVLTKGGQG